jgi:hypothetical protein
MKRPLISEYNEYYHRYVTNVQADDVIECMQSNLESYVNLLSKPNINLDYKYGPDKWTVRECIVHLCDSDKIFAYRALRISRGDETSLTGFEQDSYIEFNDFLHLSAEDLIAMIKTTINSTMTMFRLMKLEDTEKIGTASNSPVSVRALAYMTAGHAIHHLNLLKDRYGFEL